MKKVKFNIVNKKIFLETICASNIKKIMLEIFNFTISQIKHFAKVADDASKSLYNDQRINFDYNQQICDTTNAINTTFIEKKIIPVDDVTNIIISYIYARPTKNWFHEVLCDFVCKVWNFEESQSNKNNELHILQTQDDPQPELKRQDLLYDIEVLNFDKMLFPSFKNFHFSIIMPKYINLLQNFCNTDEDGNAKYLIVSLGLRHHGDVSAMSVKMGDDGDIYMCTKHDK